MNTTTDPSTPHAPPPTGTAAAAGQVAATAARVYEEQFVPALFAAWAKPLVDAAGIAPGHTVVDIGCGTGVGARTALTFTGTDGAVIGIDPNPGMLAVARSIEPRVEWRPGRAESLPVDDASADRVIAGFSLMFVDNSKAAAVEMARILRPGGIAAAATWAEIADNPGFHAMHGLLAELFGSVLADGLLPPFSIGTEDALRRLLAPGFADITVERQVRNATFASIDDWVHTEIRGWALSEQVDDEMYEHLLGEARRRWSHFTDAGGRVSFPSPALVATARMSR